MIFHSGGDPGCNICAWDQKKARLIIFKDGKYETDDPHEIKILENAGYRSDDDGRKTEQRHVQGQAVEEKPKGPNFHDLRQEAKEREIEGYGKMNKEQLIAALSGQ